MANPLYNAGHYVVAGKEAHNGFHYEQALQCIRCSACLNIYPVYREVGGHVYGSPYSGPIGAVVTPLIYGLEEYAGLPHAISLCGACLDACPVRIYLPRMLLELRAEEVRRDFLPAPESLAERAVAWGLGHERLYRLGAGLGRLAARPPGRSRRTATPICRRA